MEEWLSTRAKGNFLLPAGVTKPREDTTTKLSCFKCGKSGHKAFNCWAGTEQKGSGGGSPNVDTVTPPASNPVSGVLKERRK